jgi:hypothetical protein
VRRDAQIHQSSRPAARNPVRNSATNSVGRACGRECHECHWEQHCRGCPAHDSSVHDPSAQCDHAQSLCGSYGYNAVQQGEGAQHNDDLSSVCACSRAHTDSKYASGCRRWKHGQAEFDTAKQDKYKAAMASAARTTADKVGIVSIIEKRRRAGSSDVQTRVRPCMQNHSFVLALNEVRSRFRRSLPPMPRALTR